ncbi:MAG: hypothetical protein JWM78_3200 [Verrucomicrobiaceae bacterium]|nr:hypothetical protein [Verrucomicrobiaceae bacterium]
MPDLIALEVPLTEDLLPFSQYLWRHGMAHRILEINDHQVVFVKRIEQIDSVRDLYERLGRGETLPEQPDLPKSPRYFSLLLRRVPITLTFVAISVIVFALTSFDDQFLTALTFFRIEQGSDGIIFGSMQQQYWRLLTPIFLHFGLPHIVFNMLWLWDLGRRVELVQGPLRLISIVALIGVASNITQALAQPSLFGGMSGVDYGLLGYCWIWGWLRRDPVLHVPVPIMIAMIAMLLLSMTGLMEFMGMGAIANAAHVGGLIMGLVLGLATILISKKPVN